jgi:hypothetical protein
MNLSRFPRRRYTQYATPIEKLERLSAFLGGVDLHGRLRPPAFFITLSPRALTPILFRKYNELNG